MFVKVLSVSAVNSYIKKIIGNDFILKNSKIKGELSNVKLHSSGHIYFSLKDDGGKINCIMFRNYAEGLDFIPEDGITVIVSGSVSVYERDGTYQVYCTSMEVAGRGELYLKFEEMKKKLASEGLFDEERKKPIPLMPKRIGVITSPTGAAVRDIVNVATRRNSFVNLIIYPSLVQGPCAGDDIVRGIHVLNGEKDVDVIILARGGGSIEELWAFNEEKVARAVATSKKPIVTGIGHETDFTLCDFVSDLRGATPSQAAEMVVPSMNDIIFRLEKLKESLNKSSKTYFENKRWQLKGYDNFLRSHSVTAVTANEYIKLDYLKGSLDSIINNMMKEKKNNLNNIKNLLGAYNPLMVMEKGYGIISDSQDKIISEIKVLKKHQKVKIKLKDGDGLFAINVVEE